VTNTLLTLAFTAGLLAPVNPCGFALLPAYLTHTATARPGAALPERLLRSLAAGAALAAGFALTLSAAGLAISAGAHQLIRAAPWLGFTVGALLALLGLAGLAGHAPRLRLRLRLPAIRPRTGGGTAGPGRWALFGVGYAAASLACTIAVLLAVITQAQASTTIAGQVVVFAANAAGSIALLLVLSAAAALAGSTLSHWARALARHQARITAALLLTGGYVAAYWWPAITGPQPHRARRSRHRPMVRDHHHVAASPHQHRRGRRTGIDHPHDGRSHHCTPAASLPDPRLSDLRSDDSGAGRRLRRPRPRRSHDSAQHPIQNRDLTSAPTERSPSDSNYRDILSGGGSTQCLTAWAATASSAASGSGSTSIAVSKPPWKGRITSLWMTGGLCNSGVG
jgi:cytochrome c-type biogenesis protein